MSNAEQAVVESQVIDEVSKKKFNIDIKNILILLIDYIAINVAYVVSLMSVTNVSIELLDIEYLTFIIRVTPFYAVFTIAVYYIFRLYIDDYKKISVREMRRLLISNFLTTMVYVLIMCDILLSAYLLILQSLFYNILFHCLSNINSMALSVIF